ncbi:MAG: preprotein translocase subunit SecG [Tissierellia bacterium]|nr:preprotein translocase subunit SecG [Tissierellia bacterium]
MLTFVSVLVVISSVALIAAVMMQESADGSMDALTGGSSESYFGKNTVKTKDAMLDKIVIIAAIVFMVSLIILAKF